MEIRREFFKYEGELVFFIHGSESEGDDYKLSLRGTDKEDVYELYKYIFSEENEFHQGLSNRA